MGRFISTRISSILPGIFVFVLSLSASSAPLDTIPPTGRMVHPKAFSTIHSNTIKISAEAEDSGSGVKGVLFYVTFVNYDDKQENKYAEELKCLGRVSEKPYEMIWNCSGIPDQDFWRMAFWCDIVDNAGNVSKMANGQVEFVVLDRNKTLREDLHVSGRLRNAIKLDGYLDDWQGFHKDSLSFINGNNTIRGYSAWDRNNLYLAITVLDDRIYCSRESDPGWEPWEDDGIEVFFDMLHDHNTIRTVDDIQLIFSPTGVHWYLVLDVEQEIRETKVDYFNRSNCGLRIMGTLNDQSDTDTGYVIETAIPWKFLKTEPENGKSIGFDIFNTDREEKDGERTFMSWAGNELYTNNNPSEWGNLVLFEESRIFIWVFVLIVAVVFISGGLILVFQMRKTKRTSAPLTQKEIHVKQAMDYILEHYSDVDISLFKVSQVTNLNKNYLSNIFKEVTKKNFTKYLNEVRIEKARGLLVNQVEKSITDVAFDVGYGTLDHFIRTFKGLTGMTPLEYRKKNISNNGN